MSGFDVQMRTDAMINQARMQGLGMEMSTAADMRRSVAQAGGAMQQQFQFNRQMRQRQQQFDAELAQRSRQFDAQIAQRASQFDRSLAQGREQFIAGYLQREGQFDASMAQNASQFQAQQELREAELALKEDETEAQIAVSENAVEQSKFDRKLSLIQHLMGMRQQWEQLKGMRIQNDAAQEQLDQARKAASPEGQAAAQISEISGDRNRLLTLASSGRVIRDGKIVKDDDAAQKLIDTLGYHKPTATTLPGMASMDTAELLRLQESLTRLGDSGFEGFQVSQLVKAVGPEGPAMMTRVGELLRERLGMSVKEAEQANPAIVGDAVLEVVNQALQQRGAPPATQPAQQPAPQPATQPAQVTAPQPAEQPMDPIDYLNQQTGPGPEPTEPTRTVDSTMPAAKAGPEVGATASGDIEIPQSVLRAGGYSLQELQQSAFGSNLLSQIPQGPQGDAMRDRLAISMGQYADMLTKDGGMDSAYAPQYVAQSLFDGSNPVLAADVFIKAGLPIAQVRALMEMSLAGKSAAYKQEVIDDAIESVTGERPPQVIYTEGATGAAASAKIATEQAMGVAQQALDVKQTLGTVASGARAGMQAVGAAFKDAADYIRNYMQPLVGEPGDTVRNVREAENKLRDLGIESTGKIGKLLGKIGKRFGVLRRGKESVETLNRQAQELTDKIMSAIRTHQDEVMRYSNMDGTALLLKLGSEKMQWDGKGVPFDDVLEEARNKLRRESFQQMEAKIEQIEADFRRSK